MKRERPFVLLVLLTVVLFMAGLFMGSVRVPFAETLHVLLGGTATKESWTFIILHSRIPASIVALLTGASLASAGLMLQTAFSNPLAGPDILGINSGAGLGVAIVMLAFGGVLPAGASLVGIQFSLVISAFVGALAVTALLLMFSSLTKSNVMLLIIGIMLNFIVSSSITLLNFFSTEEGVHSYTMWGMGTFGGVTTDQLPLFCLLALGGLAVSLSLVKPLNALLLGAHYAENLGINVRRTRILLLLSTGLLVAVTTAYCGPISFIGLAVPHMARLLLGTTDHKRLMPATLLCGAAVALMCNLISTLPTGGRLLPLNAITPIIGAPVIIFVILKDRR